MPRGGGQRQAVEVHELVLREACIRVAAGKDERDRQVVGGAPGEDGLLALREQLSGHSATAADPTVLVRIHPGVIEDEVEPGGIERVEPPAERSK
jgi:hypothetical protein